MKPFTLEQFTQLAKWDSMIEGGQGHAIPHLDYALLMGDHKRITQHMPLNVYMMYRGLMDDAIKGQDITLAYGVMIKSKEYRIWRACQGESS